MSNEQKDEAAKCPWGKKFQMWVLVAERSNEFNAKSSAHLHEYYKTFLSSALVAFNEEAPVTRAWFSRADGRVCRKRRFAEPRFRAFIPQLRKVLFSPVCLLDGALCAFYKRKRNQERKRSEFGGVFRTIPRKKAPQKGWWVAENRG
jgi:hypothetical protein